MHRCKLTKLSIVSLIIVGVFFSGCGTMIVGKMQNKFSKEVSSGTDPEVAYYHLENTPINFPFPRTRWDFYSPIVSLQNDFNALEIFLLYPIVLGQNILDIPFLIVVDLLCTPYDIYGTATGWYDTEYAKVISIKNENTETSEDRTKTELK